jgi:hypothetical protein
LDFLNLKEVFRAVNEGAERRRQPRKDVEWPVTVYVDGITINGEAKNISTDGISICCEEPLPIEKPLQIGVIPPDHPMIGLSGKVVWSDMCAIGDGDEAYGMGVCFVEISDEDRKLLGGVLSGSKDA